MPAVTRELSIVYSGLTVGGSTDRLLDGTVVINEGPDAATINFSFVTTASSEALFATEIAAVETAFRTPRGRLRVIQGSQTLYDWNPSTDSGFNQAPTINHPDHDSNSGRSRYYEVTIEVGLPADEYSTDGRQDSTITLDFTPARKRSITMDVTYTALAGTSARTQYNLAVATYQNTLTAAFGGTWELVEESVDTDDQDKICNARRTLLEIIYNESAGTLDDPDIVQHEINVSLTRSSPGDSPQKDSKRFVELSVTYAAFIDKERTQELKSKYESLRSFIIQTALSQAGQSSGALIDENPSYDLTENRITATLTIWCLDGSQTIEYRETQDTSSEEGLVFLPIWTGRPLDRYIYQGPRSERITLTIVERKAGRIARRSSRVNLGIGASSGAFDWNIAGGGLNVSQPKRRSGSSGGRAGIAGAYLISRRTSNTPLKIGIQGRTIEVEDITTVETWERATPFGMAKPPPKPLTSGVEG